MLLELGISLLVLLFTLFFWIIITAPFPRPSTPKEQTFAHLKSRKHGRFPTFDQSPTMDLSIVIPAYNETKRLSKMLDEACAYLKSRLLKASDFSFEILVVDDGSKDATTDLAMKYGRAFLKTLDSEAHNVDFRVMTLEKNRGKGGAVTQGILASRGQLILFADADGASKFSDLSKLEKEMSKMENKKQGGVVIGSRAHLVKSEAVVKRSFIRNILMKGFHVLVSLFGVKGIQDTQCGFKLFTRESAKAIFKNMHVEGWIFDIEVLILAEKQGIKVKEVGIDWHEVEGTKLNLTRDAIWMLKDLIMLRICYFIERYKIKI